MPRDSYIVYSVGQYYNGLLNQGSYGFWWSSTASNATQAYSLYLYSSNTGVNPADLNSKEIGRAVRCLL